MVFHGEHTAGKDGDAASYGRNFRIDARQIAEPKDQSAYYACHSVYLFAEDKRDIVDEHIAEYAARSSCHAAHDNGDPEGIIQADGLFDAGYSEEGEAYGIENEPCTRLPDKLFAEYDDPKQGYGGDDEIDGIGHPKRTQAEQQVAKGSAAYGGSEANDVCAEPIELLGRGHPDAGYGKGHGSNDVKKLIEREMHGVWFL